MAAYSFLMKCPVLLQLDLKLIAEKFKSVDLPVLAVGKHQVIHSCLKSETTLKIVGSILCRPSCSLLPK